MSDLLQTIKDQVCIDFGYKSFDQMYGYNNVFFVKQFYEEVCKRYAFEVAKASLKEASNKATKKTIFDPDGPYTIVDKESITDESNIKL